MINIRHIGKIFSLNLVVDTHSIHKSSVDATPVPKNVLKEFHSHLKLKYGQRYQIPGQTAYNYLIRGEVVEITRQGHKNYKSIRVRSNTQEGIVSLLEEGKVEA